MACITVLSFAGLALASELPPGGTFADDDGNTHEGNIEAIAAAGITRGCNPPSNTLYCPRSTVTRGQMAAFLGRALNLPGTDTDFFTDDAGSTFETDINRLAAAGITRGCNPPANTLFCPSEVVTRGQMAALVVRAFGYTDDGGGDLFTDDDGSIFETDIDRLVAAGVTRGCNPPTGDRYCPNDFVLRDQMASFLARALDLEPTIPPPRDPPDDSPVLESVTREAWGAVPADTSKMTTHTIDTLTVHHAGDQSATTGPSRYRSWQNFHMSRGWGDVAYHFIIGVDGTVYQARDTAYEGDTGTNYDPNGHFLVVVEGNFEKDVPTQAQLDSLVTVLAWAATSFDVSPSTIGGHRDHAATACPGGNLYPYIASGDLETDVRGAIGDS